MWGLVNDPVHDPPLPNDIQELKECTTTALKMINCDMLYIWGEFFNCADVGHALHGCHICSDNKKKM